MRLGPRKPRHSPIGFGHSKQGLLAVTRIACVSYTHLLNLVTNLLNPANLLQTVEGQLCNAVTSTWNSWLGNVQCGLTVTGFNFGFGGLGGGLSCPKLTFGGGGPPIATIGLGVGTRCV